MHDFLAVKFYLNWGKEKTATGYMQPAYYWERHGIRIGDSESNNNRKHRGKIHVNSRLGEGTEFIITLPTKAKIKS